MRRPLLLLAATAALLPLSLRAVTVSIYASAHPTCTYSNGRIQANASGGVGPYTYLWNTGETASQLTGIPAGAYSVTVTDANLDQANANIDLTSAPYELFDAFYVGSGGRCGQMSSIGVFPVVGPAPYTMDGQVMNPVEIDPIGQPGEYVYAASFYPPVNGSNYTFAFQDGNGCTGTIFSYQGWPVQWPSLNVLDVQGSCAGGANGAVTFQAGLEGHLQNVNIELRRPNYIYIDTWEAGQAVNTITATGLFPGQYWLRQWMTSAAFLPGSGCGDSIMVTVPDLGNTCGNVSGTAYMDDNMNCTEQYNEPTVPGTVMEILPGPYYTITNSAGTYSTHLPLGSYTIEQQSATVVDHCNAQQAPFDLPALVGLATVNMGDTSLLPLDVMLSAANGPARPGFPFQVSLNMRNLTPAASGATSTVLTLDPTFTYVSSSPAGVVSGNTITWDQAQLTAFQERTIHVNLQVPPDINLLGMTFNNTVAITTANTDANTVNNSFLLPVTVTGAYDPNEKQAMTSSRCSTSSYFIDADNYIDYTIRFQNTGSDTAFNIVVTDTIAAELDLGTFIAGACSHPYSVDIRNGNALRFAFYNIQLPDSNMNEFASHGFVSFRMRPRMPLTAGTVIANTANIFFDFNEPVITAPSVLTAEFSTGVPLITSSGFELFPNPAQDQVTMHASSVIRRVIITAMDGRTVMDVSAGNHLVNINISGLHSGPYVLASQLVTGEWLRKPFVIARTQTRP